MPMGTLQDPAAGEVGGMRLKSRLGSLPRGEGSFPVSLPPPEAFANIKQFDFWGYCAQSSAQCEITDTIGFFVTLAAVIAVLVAAKLQQRARKD